MGKYQYTYMGEGIPHAPIITVHLTNRSFNSERHQKICRAFLDTGSDCTLIPISFAHEVNAKFLSSSEQSYLLGVGGGSIKHVLCSIGIVFDEKYYSDMTVMACHDDDLARNISIDKITNEPFYHALIGRDFMCRHKIKFDGIKLEFAITKPPTRHPKDSILAVSPALLHHQR